MKHFINIFDHSTDELKHVLSTAVRLKARMKSGISDMLLCGKTLGMYFEKPSLRTRVSLEVAATSMGAHAINLDTGGVRMGERESICDQAKVMSRFVDIVTIRTFEHEIVESFATHATIPVINTLSDYSHPTQALADILTINEHCENIGDRKLVFVGDGNNTARSLAALCAKLEIGFVLSSPEGYGFSDDFLKRVEKVCLGADVAQVTCAKDAVKNACAVYTDVWASMGQEGDADNREKVFADYQVNSELMACAPDDALVLHCLPAHRGLEITDEVIDSSVSVVYDEAENRMHINRALFAVLFE